MTRKPIIYSADAARIDEHRDGRIAIIVDTDEGDKLYVDIHDCALAFYASVQANLRPYALEAEEAQRTMPSSPGAYSRMWGELDESWPEAITSRVDMDLVRDLERGK